jgi:menaquinone-dependent protoporphyrinogen IX oxidase
MNGVVLFKSKYGSTAQYAAWIGQLCHLPVADIASVSSRLAQYDYVVVGSPVYTGKLLLRKWLKKYQQQLVNKKLFFFIVGGTPEEETTVVEKIIERNIPGELRVGSEIYYLSGSLNVQRLSLLDRLLLSVGARFTNDRNQQERMRRGFEQVKFSHLRGIIKSICNYSGQESNPEPAGTSTPQRLC